MTAMSHAHAPGTQRPRRRRQLDFLATTILLPLEIYEIIDNGTPLKVIGFIINLAVVIYLLDKKRLFGLRGGGAAEEAERAADGGWPAIERATPGTPETVDTVSSPRSAAVAGA